MPARTLIITNDFPPTLGGIETYLRSMCRLLDHQVVVLTARPRMPNGKAEAARYDWDQPYQIVRLGRALLPTSGLAKLAARLIRQHQVEAVLFGAVAPLALIGRQLRCRSGVRMLGLTHGHEVWWSQAPGARWLWQRMVTELDVIGFVSQFTGNLLAKSLSPAQRRKLRWLPPVVDHEFFQVKPEPQKRLLAAGRFVLRKGFHYLLKAWEQARLSDWELLIAGSGPQKSRLQRASARLPQVRITPTISHADMPQWLARGTGFIYPSRTLLGGLNAEALGLGAVEAGAAGLPVVVTDSGGLPETVPNRNWVVPQQHPDELVSRLAAALRQLVTADDLGAQGLQAREHARQFGPGPARRRWHAALRELS